MIGDKVFARDYSSYGKWIAATISQVKGSLSYEIQLPNGSIMHRHVNQLHR